MLFHGLVLLGFLFFFWQVWTLLWLTALIIRKDCGPGKAGELMLAGWWDHYTKSMLNLKMRLQRLMVNHIFCIFFFLAYHSLAQLGEEFKTHTFLHIDEQHFVHHLLMVCMLQSQRQCRQVQMTRAEACHQPGAKGRCLCWHLSEIP